MATGETEFVRRLDQRYEAVAVVGRAAPPQRILGDEVDHTLDKKHGCKLPAQLPIERIGHVEADQDRECRQIAITRARQPSGQWNDHSPVTLNERPLQQAELNLL